LAIGLYSVKQYTPSLFKVSHLKGCRIGAPDRSRTHPLYSYQMPAPSDEPGSKFESSLSRAKSQVHQYAICNEWDWFCTFTLDKTKKDRFDLKAFNRDLSLFLRHYRRKCPGLQFLLIPEHHDDGAWHMHGLISGLSKEFLAPFVGNTPTMRKLRRKGYLNWPDYQERFGFCSFGRIRSHGAVSAYITKYLNKSLSARIYEVGSHLYYASRGLKRAERVMFGWAFVPDVFKKCFTFHSDFVSSVWFCADRDNVLGLFEAPDEFLLENGDDFSAILTDDPDCPWGIEVRPWAEIETEEQLKMYDERVLFYG